MAENFFRRAAHVSQFLDELVFGQVVSLRLDPKLWRTAAGNKERARLSRVFAAYETSKLETHQRAHAVTEESKRPVQVGLDRLGCRAHQRFDAHEAWKPELRFPSGHLQRLQFDGRRQIIGPGAKRTRAAAGIRETEEPQRRILHRPLADEPDRALSLYVSCQFIPGHRCN